MNNSDSLWFTGVYVFSNCVWSSAQLGVIQALLILFSIDSLHPGTILPLSGGIILLISLQWLMNLLQICKGVAIVMMLLCHMQKLHLHT